MSGDMRRDRNFQFVEVASSGSGSIGRIRREWADDYKAEMAARSLVPGVNASALAREIGISPGQLFGWRRFARDRGLLHDLEKVPLAVKGNDGSRAVIEIVVDGVTIRASAFGPNNPRGALGMIPAGVKIFLAATPIDLRKGPDSLLALVRDAGSDPFSGALYAFRARRADRIKIVWWDGTGVCLYAKRLEKSQFIWPRVGPARIQLNHVQALALLDGLDWKKVRITAVKPLKLLIKFVKLFGEAV